MFCGWLHLFISDLFLQVPLPQLGFDEPERICDNCVEVTALVTKSRSLQMVSY